MLSFTGIKTLQFPVTAASTTWTIEHGLKFNPTTDVLTYVNGVLTKVHPLSIEYPQPGTIVINWTSARTGFVLIANTPGALPVIPSDPQFANVVCLLHLDESMLDTMEHNVVPTGDAALSSAVSKFGGSSLHLGGVTSLVSIVNKTDLNPSSDFTFGTGDYTVEAWIYPTAFPGDQAVIWTNSPPSGATYANTTHGVSLLSSGSLRVQSAYSVFITGTTVLALNTWTHVALSRVGGVMRLFINGELDETATVANDFSHTLELKLGGYGGTQDGQHFTGYVDEFRVTKSVGRYTADFAVPTAAFADK